MSEKQRVIPENELKFFQDSDGAVGVGACLDKEAGGMQFVLMMPEWMAEHAAKQLLRKAGKP